MGSIEDSCRIPSVSYAELLQDNTKAGAAETFVQALTTYGACRVRGHGIPQDVIDNCFEKSWTFFNRDPEVKIVESSTIAGARYVPFGSETIRGEAHLDETLEFQYGAYSSPAPLASGGPAREVLDACRPFHEECNRIHRTLLDAISSSLDLPQPLTSIHSPQNTYLAPYFYHFPDPTDKETLRVPPHIDPTSLLFNFQDPLGGLKVADFTQLPGKRLSAQAVSAAGTRFIPARCQPGEFLVLAGNLLRKIVGGDMKHSVHCVERPVGSSGFHLNYWTIPDLDTVCGTAGKEETVKDYLARVFPSAFGEADLRSS
ncbi:Clavaminate synthase-like protein [Aspergillus carlsbadensis]|nr:Clavaminate synthase-like protein [Aspergillus carlsbadensis]